MWYLCSLLLTFFMIVSCNKVTMDVGPKSVTVVAPSEMLTGHCTSWELRLSGKPTKTTLLNLSLNTPDAKIYSDVGCTTAITQISLPARSTVATVYVQSNLIRNITMTASVVGMSDANATLATTLEFTEVTLAAGAREAWGYYPGVGTGARLPGIRGMASDGTYIYMANYWGHIITKMNIATREMSFVAGSLDNPGWADGVGANAQFFYPYGLTLLNNKLYVADWWNNVIREIDLTTNNVVTVAGEHGNREWNDGIGLNAGLSVLFGLTNDGTNIYFSDSNSNTIRKLDPTTYEVTTLAGTIGAPDNVDDVGAAARFHTPALLDTDGTYLYIPDVGGHVIRQLELATNNVTTIAGTYGVTGSADGFGLAATFSSPSSVKYDNGFLWIVDTGNDLIRKMNLTTGEVTTVVGATGFNTDIDGSFVSTRFDGPSDLLVLGDKLYVGGVGMTGLRELDLVTQMTSTILGYVVGDAWTSRDGVGSIARINWTDSFAAGDDYLYTPDWGGNSIRRMSYTTFEVETIAGSGAAGADDGVGLAATFTNPVGLAKSGNFLYVSETDHIIRRIDLTTNTVTTIAGLAGAADTVDGIGALARFNNPSGLAINGNDLYVLEATGKTIRKIDLSDNSVTTVAGTAGVSGTADGLGAAASFTGLNSATVLGGYLYISDYNGQTIRRMDLSNYDVTTLAGLGSTAGNADGIGAAARFDGPYQITNDGTNLYVADMNNHLIRKINPTTAEVTTVVGNPGGLGYYADRDSDFANATLDLPSALVWTPQGFYWSNDGLNITWLH
jgi:hypothetical protein